MTPRRRAAVLLLWLAAVLACAWQIVHTRFAADLTAFLPASPDERQRVLIDQLKAGLPARTLMLAIEGGQPGERTAASRALAEALRHSGLFEQVNNGQTDAWAGVGEWIVEHRYALSPAIAPERFTPGGLREAIDDSLSLLGTPAGNGLKALIDRDPTGETVRIAEQLIPSRGPRTEDGVWVGRTAPRAILMGVVKAEGADLDAQARALQAVRDAFAPQQAKTPGLTLQMSGTPAFSVDSRARMETEIRWLVITGSVVISLLLLAAFASLPALALAALPVASGVVAGIAAVSLAFGSVHGATLGFGSTLIGEAVDYAIYYLIQARARGWREWLASGWPTVRLGLLTSVCGFGALVFSGFPGLAQLGVFSIAGLCAAAATTRWVLPVLRPEGAAGQGLRRHLARVAAGLIRVLPATRRAWWALGAAGLVFLVWRGDPWTADLASLSPVPREWIALDESLRAEVLSGDAGALVVVQGADAERTLQAAEAAGAKLDALVERRVIAGYDSPARLVPSLATQQRRQAALPDEAALRPALAEATAGGPLRTERLGPFIADLQRARAQAPVTPASVQGSAVGPIVNALLLQRDDGRWAALLPLQPLPGAVPDVAAVAAALQGVPGAQALDVGSELSRLYRHYLREAEWQALLGALGVVALIAITLRSPRRVLAVCLPLALAVLLTMAGLSAAGVALGILHLVGLLLVVAVGSNYALFFDQVQGAEALDDDTLASLLLANLTTVVSFVLIGISHIPALSAIGLVVAPGALLALWLAAAFAPRRV